jgi:RHS repeat-associated protein
VSTQYFNQGVIAGGTPYYYVQDELGSVRQLVTTSGSVAVQYDYDPYGNPTTVSGTAVSDIGYAGYFYHPGSGLEFALYRAYDPTHARWLNRDPIAETGGVNLYAYVNENPISFVDPFGLCPNKITCGTVLPNGQTVGSYVSALSNQINDAANAAQMVPTPYGLAPSPDLQSPYSVAMQVYSGTNFKIMFQGQGNAAFLGDAGNFAYAAVSANVGVPLSVTEAVAGAYAQWAGHQDTNGPWGMDDSATAQVPAGYGAGCMGY